MQFEKSALLVHTKLNLPIETKIAKIHYKQTLENLLMHTLLLILTCFQNAVHAAHRRVSWVAVQGKAVAYRGIRFTPPKPVRGIQLVVVVFSDHLRNGRGARVRT